jgi:murein L,D-transpeptidase YafK
MTRTGLCQWIVAGLLLLASVVSAVADTGGEDFWTGYAHRVHVAEAERLFLKGMEDVRIGRLATAEATLAQLVAVEPRFRLAQLVYADLLQSRHAPVVEFGSVGDARAGALAELQSMLEEARARMGLTSSFPAPGKLPQELLWFAETQHHAIVVDLSLSRLYLFRNEQHVPRLVADYYVSSGRNGTDKERQGDKKTPVGLYFITGFLHRKTLSDLYGAGALPMNYPNERDRILRRSGDGIWLHGTPADTYSRPPRVSDGCVVLTNNDFQELADRVGAGTPVVLARSVRWLDPEHWSAQRESFLKRVEQWYQDWRSRDPERVLRHYSQSFDNGRDNYGAWSQRIHASFTDPDSRAFDFRFVDLSILGYPGDLPMMVVTFTQQPPEAAETPGVSPIMQRRQYWLFESEQSWRIIYDDVG